MRALWLSIALIGLGSTARSEVLDSQPGGFEVRETAEIAAPAAKVWEALAGVGRWWDPVHTYSHDAANLTLDPAAGGCFCERWAGGAVRHMQVLYASPPKALRLDGALGPLQAMAVTGRMNIMITEASGRSTLALTYTVAGYAPGGLSDMAKPVDGVLAAQVDRLKHLVETGRPE